MLWVLLGILIVLSLWQLIQDGKTQVIVAATFERLERLEERVDKALEVLDSHKP